MQSSCRAIRVLVESMPITSAEKPMDRPDERLKTLLHQESNALVQAILQLALAHGFTD